MSGRAPYQVFEHTADVGVSVRGRTLARLFENASRALFDLVCDPRTVRPRRRRSVQATGSALDDLLVRWLSELLYMQETGWRFRSCIVRSIDRRDFTVQGTALGEPWDAARHARLREVKAVTYHQLRLKRGRDGWRVRIVFDV